MYCVYCGKGCHHGNIVSIICGQIFAVSPLITPGAPPAVGFTIRQYCGSVFMQKKIWIQPLRKSDVSDPEVSKCLIFNRTEILQREAAKKFL